MHPRSGELFQAGPRDGDITGQLESKPGFSPLDFLSSLLLSFFFLLLFFSLFFSVHLLFCTFCFVAMCVF